LNDFRPRLFKNLKEIIPSIQEINFKSNSLFKKEEFLNVVKIFYDKLHFTLFQSIKSNKNQANAMNDDKQIHFKFLLLIFFHLFDESFDCIDQTTLSKADQSLITF
jgi:hypothetical protein